MTPEALISTRFLTMGYHAFDVPVRTRITINICGDLKKKKSEARLDDRTPSHHLRVSPLIIRKPRPLGYCRQRATHPRSAVFNIFCSSLSTANKMAMHLIIGSRHHLARSRLHTLSSFSLPPLP